MPIQTTELSFFPPLEDSETLYSVCARYHHRSGNPHWSNTGDTLFGFPRSGGYAQLPMGLKHFSAVAFPENPDIEVLLRKHTISSLFLSLLDSEKKRQFIRIRSAAPAETAFQKLGLPGNSRLTSHPLKYCAQCVVGDHRFHGYSFWHREHQFPGVWICRTHGTPLIPQSREKEEKTEWIRCPEPNFIIENSIPHLDIKGNANLLRLSDIVFWLSEQTYISELHLNALVMRRLEEAANSNDKKLLSQAIARLVHDFLSSIPLSHPALEFSELRKPRWLASFTSTTQGLHPLQWALLLALFYSSKDLDSESPTITPFERSYFFGQSFQDAPIETHHNSLFHNSILLGLDIRALSRSVGIPKEILKQLLNESQELSDTWALAKQEHRRRLLRSFVLHYARKNSGTTLKALQTAFPLKIRWLLTHDASWIQFQVKNKFMAYEQIPLF